MERAAEEDPRMIADAANLLTARPLLLRGVDAAALIGVSPRQFRRLDGAGAVPLALRIGVAKRWSLEDLVQWIAADCPSRDQFRALKKSRRLVLQSGRKHEQRHEDIEV